MVQAPSVLNKKSLMIAVSVMLLLTSIDSMAQIQTLKGSSSFDVISGSIGEAISSIVTQLQAKAILWLSLFVLLQFLITNIGLLKSGADIEAIFGKLLGSLLWFGVCFYIIDNGSKYIEDVGNSFLSFAGAILKTGPLDAGILIDQGIGIGSNLIATINKVAGVMDVGAIIVGGLCGLFLIAVMAYIACKVFIIKIELALIVMLSPLSFSFLGLNALKDQGIAPFKSLIALLYRLIILAVIISAIGIITGKVADSIKSIYDNADLFTRATGVGNGVWPSLLGICAVYFMFGFLAYKSDGIAASLASGSSNLGSADVASAAAMGAAMGAAVATGGSSMAAGATRAGQPMGEFMKGLMGGGGGSVSNASSSGAGQSPVGPAPSRPAMSLGGNAPAATNKPPSRPSAPPSSTRTAPAKTMNVSGLEQSASIGGSSNSEIENKLDKLTDAMSNQSQKGFKDRMAEMNDHVARDGASTHVSINTHHTD